MDANFLKHYDTIAKSYRKNRQSCAETLDRIREERQAEIRAIDKAKRDPILSVEQRQIKALKELVKDPSVQLPPLDADTSL
jgi:hypothetical protein